VKEKFFKKTFLISSLIFLLSSPLIFSQETQTSSKASDSNQIDLLIQSGIDLTIRERYDLAENDFKKVIFAHPENPAGYFFLGATYQMQMMDWVLRFREKEFFECMQKAIELSLQRLKRDEKDKWAYFYLGNSYGARAIYDAKRGKWWSGFKYGLKARSALKKALEIDSLFYDCYVGLGSYHYWVSVYTKIFHWLPFLKDERKRGIEEMKITSQKSIYSQTASLYGLIWIYINEKKFDDAVKLAKQMDEKYPESKLFLWGLGEAYFVKEDWAGAIDSYNKLLERIGNEDKSRYANTIECRSKIAEAYFKLGNKKDCLSECDKIFSYPLHPEVKKEHKDNLEKLKKLREKCLASD
jgi:tetratricopeptide (TPR) repeat protein